MKLLNSNSWCKCDNHWFVRYCFVGNSMDLIIYYYILCLPVKKNDTQKNSNSAKGYRTARRDIMTKPVLFHAAIMIVLC